ncbi:DUF3108 domain-containing protein [Mucilaginibacter polytrichastri]|uniref:Uncharacterized protein n=1 Tax=Mucilaginibacter polytrichastri TaxID=1302689 RepID=A0A1Q6A5J6_9SPHI|nr:hypothetical protein [Mucilaginibacter polytrichastri]OKS89273.1 hypothetical protein RG47T_4757 [Mucilaginibacter polytrichastri]SFS75270.1 hypothetical protein SAMN04487890_103328 [Mucilaginibacter polytrichastri]
MKLNRYLFAALLSFCPAIMAFAQTDTVTAGNHKLITPHLKPGQRQYLVYFQAPAQTKTLRFSLWTRNIGVEKLNGEDVFVTTQHWYGTDTANYRTVRSINTKADFAPIFHVESIGGKLKAYNWEANKITGADTTANNLAKNFSLKFDHPSLNWNLDIETFEMLPLAEGKNFAIYFYDAGATPPAYVVYKVTGSEVVSLNDSKGVDCWKLFTEGKTPNGQPYTETYWISKKNHELLKEEDAFNGMYRYKIKLPGLTPDLLSRFKQ